MKVTTKKTSIISSLVWKFMERGGTQGIQFIVQIILARVLLPRDYGVIAIVAIFISLANVFVQRGFNTALIQRRKIDEMDLSTVFWISLFMAAVIYMIFFVSSPFISNYYDMPVLKEVLRILSLTLFTGAFNSIQNAIISRNMEFKKLFQSSILAVIFSGAFGIIFALLGFGVWALVMQQLTYHIIVTIVLFMKVKWLPKLQFSKSKALVLFGFGWKVLATSIIDTLYTDLRTLIIGKLYQPNMLGFYNRGKQFPALIITNINGSIQSVMLPALSSHQDDKIRVKELMRRSIVTSSFIVFPLLIGLLVVSDTLIVLLLTEKWTPAIPFLQIYCLSYAFFPIHTSNLQAINALGRSDIFLKLEIYKKILGFVILLISIRFGIYAIALGELLAGFISMFINAHPNKKLLNYSYKEQITDILPSILLSTMMGVVIYLVNFIDVSSSLILLLQIVIGIFIYYMSAKIFKVESLIYLESILIPIIKKKKRVD